MTILNVRLSDHIHGLVSLYNKKSAHPEKLILLNT
jgi:hypothetical protein